jgi:hypothetical protein
MASEIRFHGKRFAWFVSDVTHKDWEWLLNSMVYGQLFPKATPMELESLRQMGERWKVRVQISPSNGALKSWPSSNTNAKVNGSMNSTPFGARVIRSGTFTLRLLTSSYTCLVRIW